MPNILIAIVSLAVLIKSANIFIDQSTALAKKIRISSFLVGFTLLALGTSLPDLVISSYSAAKGLPEIAISTFLGSAIVKTSLILGILALFTDYKLSEIDIKRNIPVNLIIFSVFFVILLLFGFQMSNLMGILTILLLCISIFLAKENNHTITIHSKVKFNLLFLLLSFGLLIISGKLCIDNISIFADSYDIAQTTVGYFILAIGTSIPELVTSLTIIKKGNLQLALGNILGSSLFDILLVSGISSFFSILNFKPFLLEFLFLMFATTIFMLFAILGKKYYISKKEGIGLILVYILFILIQSL
jgi:cation:H+ antiporter